MDFPTKMNFYGKEDKRNPFLEGILPTNTFSFEQALTMKWSFTGRHDFRIWLISGAVPTLCANI
jgi:hypothetical protein